MVVVIRKCLLVSNIPIKVSLLNKVLDLVLQVVTFLHVMSVFSIEMTVSTLIAPFEPHPDQVGELEEPFISDLEEDFCPSRDEGDSWWEIVYPCISDPDGEDEGGQASSSLAREGGE
ncbi:hypothetical protein BHM03_00055250 [Ensete ventricosum]|nr:hypothetical protein BHM03_00055250 [Ensete ventricosum]